MRHSAFTEAAGSLSIRVKLACRPIFFLTLSKFDTGLVVGLPGARTRMVTCSHEVHPWISVPLSSSSLSLDQPINPICRRAHHKSEPNYTLARFRPSGFPPRAPFYL